MFTESLVWPPDFYDHQIFLYHSFYLSYPALEMLLINVLFNAKLCCLQGLEEMDIEQQDSCKGSSFQSKSRALDDRLYISWWPRLSLLHNSHATAQLSPLNKPLFGGLFLH